MEESTAPWPSSLELDGEARIDGALAFFPRGQRRDQTADLLLTYKSFPIYNDGLNPLNHGLGLALSRIGPLAPSSSPLAGNHGLPSSFNTDLLLTYKSFPIYNDGLSPLNNGLGLALNRIGPLNHGLGPLTHLQRWPRAQHRPSPAPSPPTMASAPSTTTTPVHGTTPARRSTLDALAAGCISVFISWFCWTAIEKGCLRRCRRGGSPVNQAPFSKTTIMETMRWTIEIGCRIFGLFCFLFYFCIVTTIDG